MAGLADPAPEVLDVDPAGAPVHRQGEDLVDERGRPAAVDAGVRPVAAVGVGEGGVHALPWADNLSVELVQVAVFLSAFSGLYFTVYAVTDDTYRQQFFTSVTRELERAVAVRAVYLRARA